MATDEAMTKAARNQALFRDVNERVREISAESIPPSEPMDFMCECADTSCVKPMALTLDEYEGIRRIPTHFPVLAGHQLPEVERVIEKTERYYVVEKFGLAGTVAVQEAR